MTHEEQIKFLGQALANRKAQVLRAEQQVAEIQTQLDELAGQVSESVVAAVDQVPERRSRLDEHDISLAELERRIAALETQTFWTLFMKWIRSFFV